MQEYYTRCPNRWASIRYDAVTDNMFPPLIVLLTLYCRARNVIREPAAEMLGTMVLILFGTGAICQVVLGGSTKVDSASKGDWLSLNMGWAVGESRPPPSIPQVVADTRAVCCRRCSWCVGLWRHIWWTYQPCGTSFATIALL
jgi:hypothetical protein